MRPGLICETATDPRAPLSKRSRIVATSSVSIRRATVSLERSVEKVSTGPVGSCRTSMNVARSANDLDDTMTGHEGHEVQPVRPDVADGTQGAASIGSKPPVPVTGEEQPVLEIAAGHQPDLTDTTRRHDIVRVLVQGVVPDVEVHRVDAARPRPPR